MDRWVPERRGETAGWAAWVGTRGEGGAGHAAAGGRGGANLLEGRQRALCVWRPDPAGLLARAARARGAEGAAAARAEPALRLWAGAEARPVVPPPGRPLCRRACAVLAALRSRSRHGLRWVSRLPCPEPAWGALGGAGRPGLWETPGLGWGGGWRGGVSLETGARETRL